MNCMQTCTTVSFTFGGSFLTVSLMSDLEDEDVTATSAAWEDGDTGDMVEETVCHSDFSAYAVTHPETDRNLR